MSNLCKEKKSMAISRQGNSSKNKIKKKKKMCCVFKIKKLDYCIA